MTLLISLSTLWAAIAWFRGYKWWVLVPLAALFYLRNYNFAVLACHFILFTLAVCKTNVVEKVILDDEKESVGSANAAFPELKSGSTQASPQPYESDHALKIVIAIIGTTIITAVWAAYVSLVLSMHTLFLVEYSFVRLKIAYLISIIIPMTIFSFFIRRKGNNKQIFLYCSLGVAGALFIYLFPDIHEAVCIMFLILPIIGWLYVFDWEL